MGSAELAQNSVQGRMMEVQQASVQMAGHSRLEQIRASMRGEQLPAGGTPATAPATRATNQQATPENPLSQ
jgi:phage shock protein A